jgi:hypothetical protein
VILTSFKGTVKWSELILSTSILASFFAVLGFSKTMESVEDDDLIPNALETPEETKADALKGAHAIARAEN